MQPHAHMLVHQIRVYNDELKYVEMQDELTNSTKLMGCLERVYLDRSTMSRATIAKLLKGEHLLNIDDCVKHGLITITESGAPERKTKKRRR